jgi:hypothetical protein
MILSYRLVPFQRRARDLHVKYRCSVHHSVSQCTMYLLAATGVEKHLICIGRLSSNVAHYGNTMNLFHYRERSRDKMTHLH